MSASKRKLSGKDSTKHVSIKKLKTKTGSDKKAMPKPSKADSNNLFRDDESPSDFEGFDANAASDDLVDIIDEELGNANVPKEINGAGKKRNKPESAPKAQPTPKKQKFEKSQTVNNGTTKATEGESSPHTYSGNL